MAVKRSLGWMGASQLVSFALQFAASIVVARLLTPYELGVYAVAVATVGALAAFQALGLGNLIIREKELTRDLVASIYTINALLAVGLASAIALAGFAGSWWFHDKHVRDVLLVMAPAPLCALIDFLPASNFEREGNFRVVAIGNGIRSATYALLTILLATLGFKFIGLALAQDLSVLFTAIYFGLIGRRFVSFRLGLSHWRPTLSYGLQLLTVSGLTSLFQRGSDIVLGRVLGIASLGVYNRASSLNAMILDRVRIAIERITFSHMAGRLRNNESLQRSYLYTVELMTSVLWPALAGLAVVSATLIRTLFGSRWQGAATPLSILATASIVQVSISLSWELFILRGELKRQSKIELVRTIIGFTVFAVACRFGLVAAACARVLDSLVANWLYRKEIERMTDTRLAQYLPIYSRSLLLVLFAAAPALVVQAIADRAAIAPLASLLISTAANSTSSRLRL